MDLLELRRDNLYAQSAMHFMWARLAGVTQNKHRISLHRRQQIQSHGPLPLIYVTYVLNKNMNSKLHLTRDISPEVFIPPQMHYKGLAVYAP
jgi:hypothetical protein